MSSLPARVALLLSFCSVVAAPGCRREEKPAQQVEKPAADPRVPERVGMYDVKLPLKVAQGGTEIRGEARIARIQVGSGKKGGGLFAVLNPALRVDGASVETDGDSLLILADLPVALRTLVKMNSIEFRGLLVRSRDGRVLLECATANVGLDGVWEMQRVRKNGGHMEPSMQFNPTTASDAAP